MPAPKAHSQGMINQYSGNAPTLRLLCSITGIHFEYTYIIYIYDLREEKDLDKHYTNYCYKYDFYYFCCYHFYNYNYI